MSIGLFGTGGKYVLSKIKNEEQDYFDNPYYTERMSLFKPISTSADGVVFVGDSITQRGLFGEMFPEVKIYNRGINSDTSEGVLNRIKSVAEKSPKKVFLMIGINDLYAKRELSEISDDYRGILTAIKTNSPQTQVYVQSVLHVNSDIYGEAIDNGAVNDLNVVIKRLAAEFDYKYIDLHDGFSENGQLNKNFTLDGIHLNGEGYAKWKEMIKFYIN
ncbi:GDSL-type esterase/lipase family protein [Exiguobacterium sp. AB2]|uniref:GDSL-type esterase/lipase family protein n=1 Tax=Exiguobacterium sp. AB2 TaxID=1484479 RepID=UPI00135F1BF8|nr:GDSL-type esterase/lipase family protein [Exiguobacterium sp. AB2]